MPFEKSTDIKKTLVEIINRINEDRRRIRLIEQNIDRVENSISSLEQNFLTQSGDVKIAIDRLNNKLLDITNKLSVVESEITRLDKAVKKAATKVELKQLESFIDLVNPITSKFVTKDELKREIEDMIKKGA